MKNKIIQPNFETIKTAFYQAYANSQEATTAILKQSCLGVLLPTWPKRDAEFKKDFTQWLDGLDIRQSGELILILKENGKPVPKWAASWKYNIDYNENGALDLIRTAN